jgi:hypothetical protein
MSVGLSAIELKLAEGVPFGSYEYISGELSTIYVKLLTSIADHYSTVGSFLKELNLVDEKSRQIIFRDSLLRRTIEDGVCQILQGIDTIDPAVFNELLQTAAKNGVTGLLNDNVECVLFNQTLGYGYVWVEDQPDTLAGRRFRDEVLKRLPGFQLHIPTRSQIEILTAGVHLAEKICPILARSALSHNFMVIIGEFKTGIQVDSLTMPGLSGVIILSPKVLSNSVEASEALFHESLHLKFLDIDYVHPLFALGFRQQSSPKVTPVWHSEKPQNGNWPIDRLLTSMHVYLALAVFHGKAAIDGGEGTSREDRAARALQCKFRAAWLHETAQNYLDCLSIAGREFVASIGAMLAELDATMPVALHVAASAKADLTHATAYEHS